MAFRRTVIRTKLSAWTCQPFCCQRADTLIPSGPQHSAEIFQIAPENEKPGVERRAKLFQIAPENEKPGVERRAKPPYQWLCAKLDIFLACARNEPHYRIYFWPSLALTLGRTFFDPTVTPLNSLVYPQAVNKYTRFPGFVKPSTQVFLELLCKSPRRCANPRLLRFTALNV